MKGQSQVTDMTQKGREGEKRVSRRLDARASRKTEMAFTKEQNTGKGLNVWHTSVILALGRLSQEDCCKFEARLGYILSSRPA